MVQKAYPGAFVERSGDWFYIRPSRDQKTVCVGCGQRVEKVGLSNISIGSGVTEEAAWARAGKFLEIGY